MSDGTTYEIDIPVNAEGVEPAAAALARMGEQMAAASLAAVQAADAVKAGSASYIQAETAADRAAKALERISLAADGQRGKLQAAMDAGDASGADRAAAKLQNLVARQAEAAAKAASTAAAMNAEAVSLDKLKSAASAAADNEARLSKASDAQAAAAKAAAKSQTEASKASEGGSLNARALSSALGKLGGPLGAIGQQGAGLVGVFQKLSKSLGAAGVYVGIAVAIVAIGTAAIFATGAIGKWAVGLADSARTQALLSDGIAGTVAGGRELDKTIAGLSNTVPQSRDELLAMAGDLAKTGLKGAQLSSALEDAAVKAAKLKWGPDFAKQMLSLDSQAARLKTNISGVFGGLKIEGLLAGLAKLIALFDSTDATGNAIKVLFESLFQPLIDGVTAFIPKAVTAFIQFEILVMKAAIAIKPFGSKIALIGQAFEIMAGLVVVAIALVIAGIVATVAAVALLVAGFLWLTDEGIKLGQGLRALGESIISGASAGFDWLIAKVNEAIDFLSGVSLAEMGKAMIDGLVAGIKGAAAGVVDSVTGAVGGAVSAAKKALGIASPSKVFAEIGGNASEGMAVGVDDHAGAAQDAMEAMVAPPKAAAGSGAGVPATATAPSSSSASSGGGGSVNLAGATFNFFGVENAEDAESRIGALLTRLLEGDVAQLGGAEAVG